jgi:cytochrome c556
MRKLALTLGLAAVLSSGLAWAALDLSDFDDDMMRDMDDAIKDLEPVIAAKNAATAGQDAQVLQSGFKETEAYFSKKGIDDAVKFARDQQDRLAQVNKFLAAGDFDGAAGAARELSHGCKTCHDSYKPLTK